MAIYSVVLVGRVPNAATPQTLTELGPLTPTSFSYTDVINAAGTFQCSTPASALNDDIKLRLRDPMNYPSEVWVYRDTVKVWAGPLMGVDVKNEIVTINASGLLAYVDYMVVEVDKNYSATDQFTIVTDLIDDWQVQAYGDFDIDTSSVGTSGTTRDLTIVGAERQTINAVLDSFIALDNGFDWYVNPSTRALVLASPQRGTDLSATYLIERGIKTGDIRLTVAPGIIVSEAFGVATGSNATINSDLSNTTVRQNFGRVAGVITADGDVDATTLADVTQGFLDARTTALIVPGGMVRDTDEASIATLEVGDTVSWTYDSGIGEITGAFRVGLKKVKVDAKGEELMEVKFL